MAKQTDVNLSALYGACYLAPTFYSHATGFGLSARFRLAEGGTNSYLETSEKEATQAIELAHNLVLRHLTLQNEYFKLGMDGEIQLRVDAFLRIWKTAERTV
jgi:hypothetical protein